MEAQITLGDIVADVILKDIKNVHLSVYPPNGHVRISAPERMSIDNVRAYAVSKLRWIKQQQKKLQSQERITPREYVNGESHYLWGKRYLLHVFETATTPHVVLRARHLELHVRPDSTVEKRAELLETWLRQQLKSAVPKLIAKWEPKIGVEVANFYVQRMKTKWGSCSHEKGNIRLNTELAKKPVECLEYIVVHEMVHLIERSHNERFINLMNENMPKWKFYREELNRLPVRHEDWQY
ncbi:metal-dependent hydrolase [Armatimonadetes bacterium Uphvl-Ar1]|nr:metal-dependent hydrolase [Armatimonadetes bacterium Uphvl-Ar1]